MANYYTSTSTTSTAYYTSSVGQQAPSINYAYMSLFHFTVIPPKSDWKEVVKPISYRDFNQGDTRVVRLRTIEELSLMLKINLTERDMFNIGIDADILLKLGSRVSVTQYQLVLEDRSSVYIYSIKREGYGIFYLTDVMVDLI